MTDDLIFREVDEDVRRDRMEAALKKYGLYGIAAAVVVIAGVAGGVVWRDMQAEAQLDRGGRFEQALDLVTGNKPAEAAEIFEQLAAEVNDTFQALAGQQAAAARAAAGDEKVALAAYDRLAANPDLPELQRDLAAIKGALIALRTDGADAALQRLAPVAEGAGPFRNIAREIKAGALVKKGDKPAAIAELKALSEDATSTANQQRRVAEYLRALGG